MNKAPPNDAELVQGIDDALDDDLLSDAYPLDEVAKELDAAGADSRELMEMGKELVTSLQRKRRLAWQDGARRKVEAMRLTLVSRTAIASLPRAELLARIDEARKDTRFAEPVAIAARNLTAEVTDEELRQVLEDLEALAMLSGGEKDPTK
jgi:hypothetical protein